MFPETLILDAGTMLALLRHMAQEHHYEQPDCFAAAMVEEIMDCLQHAPSAFIKLFLLADEFAKGNKEYLYHVLPAEFAQPILSLGSHLLDQLRRHNVYLPDGTLPYYYRPTLHTDFADILLQRTHELT